MKTITEFSGFVLSEALKKLAEITPKPAKEDRKNKQDKKPTPTETASPTEAAQTQTDAPADVPAEAVQVQTDAPAEAAQTPAEEKPFDPATAIGEAFKLEGDKLAMFMSALEVAKRRPQHIKRIIVMTLNEGEKAPSNTFEKDGKYYLLEQFFVPQQQRRDKKDRFGKGGGKDKRRGGKRGDRNQRRGGLKNRPQEGGEQNLAQTDSTTTESRKPRRQFNRRPPAPHKPAPGTGQKIIALVNKDAVTSTPAPQAEATTNETTTT